METETVNDQLMPASAPTDLRVGSARGRVVQRDAWLDIRQAWQSVLGPAPLLPELIEQLLLLSKPREFSPGRLVQSRQEVARSLGLLVAGDIGFGVMSTESPFHPERSVRGPAWLDISSVWLGRTHAQDAVAFSEVRVVNVSGNAYQALMNRFPELARRTVLGLAGQVYALTQATHDLMHKDADARLAAWLLERCSEDATPPHEARVVLQERKRDIASQLAITPETLSRLLRQLSADGLVDVRGYTIGVLDPQGLRLRAQL